jgi:hypothetical protein
MSGRFNIVLQPLPVIFWRWNKQLSIGILYTHISIILLKTLVHKIKRLSYYLSVIFMWTFFIIIEHLIETQNYDHMYSRGSAELVRTEM